MQDTRDCSLTVARIGVSYSDFNTKPIRIPSDYLLDMAEATVIQA